MKLYRDSAEITFAEIEFAVRPALYSECRIAKETIPKGLYRYEVRHADNDCCDPASVHKGVLVNFHSTLITTRELDLGVVGIEIEHGFDFTHAEKTDLTVFAARHHVGKKEPAHER
jgi:hypothetical protein